MMAGHKLSQLLRKPSLLPDSSSQIVYEYPEPSTCLKHYLYNNQNDGEYLLPEFRHLDFLWLLKDDIVSEDSLQQLVQSIRTVNGVQLVVELMFDKIKNKEHLVF